MLNPDALSKETDAFKAAAAWINPMKRDCWDKFFGAVRGVEAEINEGRTKVDDWAKVRAARRRRTRPSSSPSPRA